MKKFKQFDVDARKERSDKLADLLRSAGIRLSQGVREMNGRPVNVIAVHPDDMERSEEVKLAAMRRENEDFVKTLRFTRRPYSDKDMLITREPNEDGFYVSGIYDGKPYDETRFRLVSGGWDHEHCYICWAKVLPGDEWWATLPPNYDDDIGLCLDCYSRLLGDDSAPE
jgi:hypothetical protein